MGRLKGKDIIKSQCVACRIDVKKGSLPLSRGLGMLVFNVVDCVQGHPKRVFVVVVVSKENF